MRAGASEEWSTLTQAQSPRLSTVFWYYKEVSVKRREHGTRSKADIYGQRGYTVTLFCSDYSNWTVPNPYIQHSGTTPPPPPLPPHFADLAECTT